ncbi:MAG: hypothetical protein QOH20_4833 [Mycobacterium sp.]|jgi:hypothetical protein|nr:hypothetical protein [Mycobacterium sp.]
MRNAPVSEKAPVGVFVGLATLDVIHRIAKAPDANQKITSTAQFVAAGGPAANAAVTFAGLGGAAILVTALDDDPNSYVSPPRIDRSTCVAALRCSVVGSRAWLSELRTEQTRKRER